MSFSARLLEWLLAPLLFLWLLSLGITFLASRNTVDSALDDHLNLAASLLHDEWRAANLAAKPSAPQSLIAFPSPTLKRVLAGDERHAIEHLIVNSRDRAVSGNEEMLALLRTSAIEGEMAEIAPSRLNTSAGSNSVLDDEFVRVVRYHFTHEDEHYRMVVAQSRARQDQLLRTILFSETIPQSAVLMISVFLVWYGLAYVVRPMQRLKRQLDTRDDKNLAPLSPQLAPSEIAPLIDSINDLIFRLQTSIDAQKRFIANAAHQLRTPLAAMRAHSELLKQAGDDSARRSHTIEQLLSTSSRANRLAKQLLSMLRAESSATTAQFEPVKLNPMCEIATRELLPLAIEKSIDVSFEPCATEIERLADATLLSEMVTNLIDNALKYTPRGGHVLVSTYANPTAIRVEDSGPGIADNERARIFAPFSRATRYDSEGHHVIGGSGLGLAIVQEVARAHGATISVSRSRWNGAAFEVCFTGESAR